MELTRLVLVLLVACSGSKGKNVEDARGAKPVEGAPAPDARVDLTGKGDVQIRVEWKNVPVAARASPGATSCGTPRPGAVAPTTTWGVPDVFVELVLPGAAGASRRLTVTGCLLSPRAVVTTKLAIASATEQPAVLRLQTIGKLPLGGAVAPAGGRDVYLPIAGHEVDAVLDPGGIYTLQLGDEVATIVASDSPFVAVTEPNGQVMFRDVPGGIHAVTAWLPARSGQPARVARGKVAVGGGALTEVTLDLTP